MPSGHIRRSGGRNAAFTAALAGYGETAYPLGTAPVLMKPASDLMSYAARQAGSNRDSLNKHWEY